MINNLFGKFFHKISLTKTFYQVLCNWKYGIAYSISRNNKVKCIRLIEIASIFSSENRVVYITVGEEKEKNKDKGKEVPEQNDFGNEYSEMVE